MAEDWRADASCATTDPELFFGSEQEPGPGMSQVQIHSANKTAAAKKICNGDIKSHVPVCPVREKCLAYALSIGPSGEYGIWGGLSSNERRSLRRRNLRLQGKGSSYE